MYKTSKPTYIDVFQPSRSIDRIYMSSRSAMSRTLIYSIYNHQIIFFFFIIFIFLTTIPYNFVESLIISYAAGISRCFIRRVLT